MNVLVSSAPTPVGIPLGYFEPQRRRGAEATFGSQRLRQFVMALVPQALWIQETPLRLCASAVQLALSSWTPVCAGVTR